METIVLVFEDHTVDAVALAEMLRAVGRVSVHGNDLTLNRGDDRCYIDYCPEDEYEANSIFEDWPAEDIPSPCAVFGAHYRSPELAVALVHAAARERSLWVDTNYDRVVRGSELTPEMLHYWEIEGFGSG